MRPVEARHLAVGRVVFGGAALIKLYELSPRLLSLSEAYRYPWWQGWTPATNLPWVWIFGWALLAGMFMVGWRVPWAGVGLALVMGLVMFTDQQLYSNHLYLMVLLALLFTWGDSGARWSADARRVGSVEAVAGLPVLLLKLQLTAVYLFAAIAKVNLGFLSGGVLAGHQPGALVELPMAWVTPSVLAPVSAIAVVIEAFLALAPWTRFRSVVPFVAIALHVGIVLFISDWVPLLVFGVAMASMFPLFWAKEQPHRQAADQSRVRPRG